MLISYNTSPPHCITHRLGMPRTANYSVKHDPMPKCWTSLCTHHWPWLLMLGPSSPPLAYPDPSLMSPVIGERREKTGHVVWYEMERKIQNSAEKQHHWHWAFIISNLQIIRTVVFNLKDCSECEWGKRCQIQYGVYWAPYNDMALG